MSIRITSKQKEAMALKKLGLTDAQAAGIMGIGRTSFNELVNRARRALDEARRTAAELADVF